MTSSHIATWKKVLIYIAVFAQYAFIALSVICFVTYSTEGFESGDSLAVLVAAHMMLYTVLAQFHCVVIRWWLKVPPTWETFTVLALQTTVASFLRGVYYYRYGDFFWLYVMSICVLISGLCFLYCLTRSLVQQLKIFREIRQLKG